MYKSFLRNRAKIVCTIGPSSNSLEMLKKLADAGMDVARLNFSHGTHESHRKLVKRIRQVSEETHNPITILQDLQGPKIRVGRFKAGEITLVEDAEFTLTVRDVAGTSSIASVSYASFNQDVEPGDMVLLDDGNLKLTVESVNGEDVKCRVIYGGVLKDHKGINLPGAILSVPALTDKDRQDLELGIELGVDYVALSFVQKPEDIDEIKSIISAAGKDIPVVAKIEKPQAVAAIDEITDRTDAIMIARGDLGVEMPTEEVPYHQKEIISLCNRKGVPVITATQMLDSMINSPRPTRAEASDVANAVLDGTDALMLSGETATGKYPLESVETMNRIISRIEIKSTPRWEHRRRTPNTVYTTAHTIGYAAFQAAELTDAAVIVCLTQSGSTAQMISRFRPSKPILALTYREKTYRRMPLLWGVTGMLCEDFHQNNDHVIERIKLQLTEKKIVKTGDSIVFTAGLPFAQRRGTNILRIEEVE